MNKILSSLLGGALGDALGYSREFISTDQALTTLPGGDWRNADLHNGPNPEVHTDTDGKALISDDTQMTIATGRALISAQPFRAMSFAQSYASELSRAYVEWSQHPDNTRAPGLACMRACEKLAAGYTWLEATDITTKGCGANMRVAPVALYADPLADSAEHLAYLTAAVTHAHPAALASAALTVHAISAVHDGLEGPEILDYLIDECTAKHPYPHDVLGYLWMQSDYPTPEAYLRAGYLECRQVLMEARNAVERGWAGQTDPCLITGPGWIAPEALAGAVLCVAGLWGNPVQVLQRAAISNGDSDSLAAIAGNVRGAAGVAWPEKWVDQLEAAPVKELHKLAETL